MTKKKIAILISGNGSNAEKIIQQCQQERINAEVVLVLSNVPNVYGLQRAANLGIESVTLDHKAFATRDDFDAELKRVVDLYSPDLLVLAGFMRILTPKFVNAFAGKMLNIHPSLLPKYPGLNTHQRAIDNGDTEHGASVHFVTSELDGGPIVLQASVPIENVDTAESLSSKLAEKEWIIYPLVVAWYCEDRLALVDNSVKFDNKKLSRTGLLYEKLENSEQSLIRH